MNNSYKCLLGLLLFISCKETPEAQEIDNESEEQIETIETLTKADSLLSEATEAHGGDLYDNSSYSFVFRNAAYSFTNSGSDYTYTLERVEEGQNVNHVLSNDNFSRSINGEEVELGQDFIDRYSESINSVIYFATLPHKLNDESVNKSYEGEIEIKGVQYEVLGITFGEDGGGKDFQDHFLYWINQETHRIDYLAYDYQSGEGGVRFRSAYNTRIIDGILFQDYINYSAEIGTALFDLPTLYEVDELIELSRIETEDVKNLIQ